MATNPRDQARLERRHQLLQAATKVFAAKGFHGATMADVARAAGVSYGVVYWYFPGKVALFEALMEAEEEELRDVIGRAVEASPDPLERLRIGIVTTLQFFDENRSLARLLFRDAYALGETFEKRLVQIYDRFTTLIEQDLDHAAGRGLLRPMDTRLTAYMVASLLGQLAFRRLTVDDGLSPEQTAEAALDFCLHGISAGRRDPDGNGGARRPRPSTRRVDPRSGD